MITAKMLKVLNRYRDLLNKRLEKSGCYKMTKKGNVSKNRIVDFFILNGRWPKRKTESKREAKLGTRFEIFISKEAAAYDSVLRRIAIASGRKVSGKRKHNVKEFRKEIINFIETNGRVPAIHPGSEMDPGEAGLRQKLDYYIKKKNDMSLLGIVYDNDKCHRSGISMKYRPLLNSKLEDSKPLIKMVK